MKKVYEPDIVIENAVPAQPDNIPAGHSRFYCEKCRTVRSPTLLYVILCICVCQWKLVVVTWPMDCNTLIRFLFCLLFVSNSHMTCHNMPLHGDVPIVLPLIPLLLRNAHVVSFPRL